jgi:hypothetical protein
MLSVVAFIHVYVAMSHEGTQVDDLQQLREKCLPSVQTLQSIVEHCTSVDSISVSSAKRSSASMAMRLGRVVVNQVVKLA